jgi:hypothetical protein
MFRTIQQESGVSTPEQLLIDTKTRWSSTYLMLHRAETNKEVRAHNLEFEVRLITDFKIPACGCLCLRYGSQGE